MWIYASSVPVCWWYITPILLSTLQMSFSQLSNLCQSPGSAQCAQVLVVKVSISKDVKEKDEWTIDQTPALLWVSCPCSSTCSLSTPEARFQGSHRLFTEMSSCSAEAVGEGTQQPFTSGSMGAYIKYAVSSSVISTTGLLNKSVNNNNC